MALAGRGDKARQLNGTTFSSDEVHELVDELTTNTTEKRRDIDGLDVQSSESTISDFW